MITYEQPHKDDMPNYTPKDEWRDKRNALIQQFADVSMSDYVVDSGFVHGGIKDSHIDLWRVADWVILVPGRYSIITAYTAGGIEQVYWTVDQVEIDDELEVRLKQGEQPYTPVAGPVVGGLLSMITTYAKTKKPAYAIPAGGGGAGAGYGIERAIRGKPYTDDYDMHIGVTP